MGSTMKTSIFNEQTSKALKNWRHKAGKNKAAPNKSPNNNIITSTNYDDNSNSNSNNINNNTRPMNALSPSVSPPFASTKLRRFKSTGHSDIEAGLPSSSPAIPLKAYDSLRVGHDDDDEDEEQHAPEAAKS